MKIITTLKEENNKLLLLRILLFSGIRILINHKTILDLQLFFILTCIKLNKIYINNESRILSLFYPSLTFNLSLSPNYPYFYLIFYLSVSPLGHLFKLFSFFLFISHLFLLFWFFSTNWRIWMIICVITLWQDIFEYSCLFISW